MMSVIRLPSLDPHARPLTHRERIDWHDHADHQLIHPSSGVLQISTGLGAWIVPPHRAVWVPAGMPHAHEAHGPTDARFVHFRESVNPLRLDRPTVLAVSPLLREAIVVLTDDARLDARQRRNLEQVVLDQLQRVEALPLHLPTPADGRLADVVRLLTDDPADARTLAELGAAVGAAERTLSRLFRSDLGMTFPQWRGQLRLHHSLKLLAGGGSVTSVAAACGYSGTSAYIEAFRSAFGTTPGKYLAR